MNELYVNVVKTPFAFASADVAGRRLCDWVKVGLGTLPFEEVECEKQAQEKGRYNAVVYANMPLMTEAFLRGVVAQMVQKGCKVVEIGCGVVAAKGYLQKRDKAKYADLGQEILQVTDGVSLARAKQELYLRNANAAVACGAIIQSPHSVQIDATAKIESGAEIMPNVIIGGTSVVKKGAVIGSFSVVQNSTVCENAVVVQSNLSDSIVGKNTSIGPFAVLKKGTTVGENVRIGDFVEIKNSTVADGVKAAHLTYVGDAEVGLNTNVGCGTVFANYDGKKKHRTKVGNDVFIGCNTNLVAPLTVGDNAYIAAATTVTEDVPQDAFVIGRVRAENKRRTGAGGGKNK